MIRDVEELIPLENQKNNIPVDDINDYFLPKYENAQAIIERREYQRKYRKENIEKIREYQRKYRAEHKEKVKEYNKKYWLKKAKQNMIETV